MAELNVSRKNIEGLLSLNDPTTKGKIFVIPDYQRPYRWETNGAIIERLCRFFKDNIPQPIVNEKEILSFELKLGSEFYRLYKIVDGDSNVLRYKLESHICDRDNSNFLRRKYIDKTASYENIQSALSGIDKEMFVRGEPDLKDDSIMEEISAYMNS